MRFFFFFHLVSQKVQHRAALVAVAAGTHAALRAHAALVAHAALRAPAQQPHLPVRTWDGAGPLGGIVKKKSSRFGDEGDAMHVALSYRNDDVDDDDD